MGKLKIEFSKNAVKDYKKLPKHYKALIDLALLKLSKGLPIDIKPIIGENNVYRIRIDKYRVLSILVENILLITKIASRGDVYK